MEEESVGGTSGRGGETGTGDSSSRSVGGDLCRCVPKLGIPAVVLSSSIEGDKQVSRKFHH